MTKRSTRLLIAVAGCGLVLSGCQTMKAGKSLLPGQTASSASVLAALDGGLVAHAGVELSKNDKQRALEAEYRALEAGDVGQSVPWKGDDASGSVIAAAPYQVGSQNCRQYTHKITADGKDTEAKGVACRNQDGTWSPI
ncbi:hypothetical protein [Oryzifoliimicrobium ureilyticus]|uniref:hypothetical protein n=1 Tax=Oryzifoliimicrobium ureilyticus TaxID=3113724 RepID=UPI003075F016